MKRIVIFLSLAVMIFSFQDVQSQRLRDRVKKVIFKEPVEVKDDSTTVVEMEDSSESSSVNFSNDIMMDALGLTGNVEHEEVYHFDAYIQMELTTYKKNGNLDDQVVYDNYVHKADADYAMEFKDKDAKSTIIFDTKNSAMLILTESDGEKTGFATSIDPEAMAEMVEDYEEEEADLDSYRPYKTGKTKVILGYSCDEYMVEEDGTEVHMWVSEKLGKEVRKEWMGNQQTFGAMFVHAHAMNGMVLEYDVVDEDGRKSVMQVTRIDLNHTHKVNTNGYTIMSMRQKTEEEKE
ncbi:MAG: DUF4412 domain-containing protein [Bacteroidota bacterium]|nr:DUF4412 domain-containing protein [Bacteroidota bacterium]